MEIHIRPDIDGHRYWYFLDPGYAYAEKNPDTVIQIEENYSYPIS